MSRPCETGTCPFASCSALGTLTDFVTGRRLPDTPAERVRQETERFLVEKKGYAREDVEVGAGFEVDLGGEKVRATADLVLRAGRRRMVVIKCVQGVLSAGERLAVSYARLMDSYLIPFAVATNGDDTSVMDARTARVTGT
ncbi:MAG: type I restriction enzyme HsdR N-terminal domain-containing protein, partial [Euryarchaeota archaeon]|nr:type I restriction enzyme HsdR N-terminal domain-containing protein [Euryarchaeota archaeon]